MTPLGTYGTHNLEQLKKDHERDCAALGYKPGELQEQLRNGDLPRQFDYHIFSTGVIDALLLGGVPAWHGDGTACVTEIIKAVYRNAEDAKRWQTFQKLVDMGELPFSVTDAIYKEDGNKLDRLLLELANGKST